MASAINRRGAAFSGHSRSGGVRRHGVLMPVAFAAALMLPGAAWAACSPPAGGGVTATCTGTTNNQDPPSGYGTGLETGLIVTVDPGASVTGSRNGVFFDTGTLTNFGTVTGLAQAGVYATTSGTVTNFGTIGGPFGIYDYGSGTITVINSGTIRATARGIGANSVVVTNSGTITGSQFGVSAGTAKVINSGTISGGVFGIYSTGTASVTNGGTIFGSIDALGFGGGNDTLWVLPGSVLIGGLNFGSGSDTVNFMAGNQDLTFTHGGTLAVNVYGGIPYVVTGSTRVVTIDPTPFALSDRVLMDFTGSVSAALDSRFDAMSAKRHRRGLPARKPGDGLSVGGQGRRQDRECHRHPSRGQRRHDAGQRHRDLFRRHDAVEPRLRRRALAGHGWRDHAILHRLLRRPLRR